MQKGHSSRATRVDLRSGKAAAAPSDPREATPQPVPRERLPWLDNAKALGVIALFYGHLVENVFLNHGPLGFLQYKLIYSFHIPLFFVLSGYIAGQPGPNIHAFIRSKFMSRIVPFLFFNLLLIPAFLVKGHVTGDAFGMKQLLTGLVLLIRGTPLFDPMTWFLVCLFSVEMIHFFLSPALKDKWSRTAAFMVLFYLAGWMISWKRPLVAGVLQVGDSWWIYEAVLAYSFYLFGRLASSSNVLESRKHPSLNVWLFILSAAVLAATFNLNGGPFFGEKPHGVVVISGGTYGNIFFFPLTALAGSLCIIALSRLIGRNRLLGYLGRNSLILMGINGLYFLFLNTFFVDRCMKLLPAGELSVFIMSAVLTAASILMCLPVVFVLERYLPQLTGNPKAHGPILPRLAGD